MYPVSQSCLQRLRISPSARPPAGKAVPVPVPVVEAAPPAEQGGLAWLLAYGLSADEVRQGATPTVTAGGDGRDTGLDQAWSHARSVYATETPGRPAADFAAPVPVLSPPPMPSPPPRKAPATGRAALPLREHARLVLFDLLRDRFMAILEACPARPGASPAEQSAAFRKWLTAVYVLGLPVSPRMARRTCQVEGWSAEQVFGRGNAAIAALLVRLQSESIPQLGLAELPEGDEKEALWQAVDDLDEYVGECVERLGDLRREDGVLKPGLDLWTRARIQRFAGAVAAAPASPRAVVGRSDT